MRSFSASGEGQHGYSHGHSSHGQSISDGPGGSTGDRSRALVADLNRYAGDERLAGIFRQMRDIVGVSQSEMARKLGTNVSTLLDFEAGAVTALPPWPETVRIVDRYALLADIDPSPILQRLLQLQPMPQEPTAAQPVVPLNLRPAAFGHPASGQAGLRQERPVEPRAQIAVDRPGQPVATATTARALPLGQPLRAASSTRPIDSSHADIQAQTGSPNPWPQASVLPASPTSAPQQVADADDDHAVGFDSRLRTRETTVRSARPTQPTQPAQVDGSVHAARLRRRRMRTMLVVTPFVLIGGLFVAMLMAPQPFYRVARMLPAPAASPILAMLDTAVLQTASVRDGLRWIELEDPRARRGDRQR